MKVPHRLEVWINALTHHILAVFAFGSLETERRMSRANGASSWRGSWTSFLTRPIDTRASSNGCTVSKFDLAIRPSVSAMWLPSI